MIIDADLSVRGNTFSDAHGSAMGSRGSAVPPVGPGAGAGATGVVGSTRGVDITAAGLNSAGVGAGRGGGGAGAATAGARSSAASSENYFLDDGELAERMDRDYHSSSTFLRGQDSQITRESELIPTAVPTAVMLQQQQQQQSSISAPNSLRSSNAVPYTFQQDNPICSSHAQAMPPL